MLPALPPADPVRVGSFAADVTWWGDAPRRPPPPAAVPPPGVEPGGVTNLAAAVRRVADSAEAGVPTHLLLMTDADADLPDPAGLTAALRGRRVTLHLLATGTARPWRRCGRWPPPPADRSVEQADPAGWVAAARRLARQAVPRRFGSRPTAVRWIGEAGPATASGVEPDVAEADRRRAWPTGPTARWRPGGRSAPGGWSPSRSGPTRRRWPGWPAGWRPPRGTRG